ncbi:MAG: hypothetical protein ABJH05_05175 [Fulvivirga sp.]
MAKDDKDEILIEELIKKRKEVNDAFIKLLGAIENNKPSFDNNSDKSKTKNN